MKNVSSSQNEAIKNKEAEEELKNAQKTEALLRMKKLNICQNAIKEFLNECKLNLSEKGILFWLSETERNMVRAWEKETGNLVYHVIKNQMEFGLCYSFLYVSQYTEEWQTDNEYLENNMTLAYVKNADDDFCSEFGSIGILPLYGGVVRTW